MNLVLLLAALALEIRLDQQGGQFIIRAAGETRGTLSVSVDQPNSAPMLGTTRIEANSLVFVPRFALQPGLRYRVRWSEGGESTVEVPADRAEPSTVVEAVYPSTNTLPENQLKFYVHFSAPMSRGEAYQRIRLLDEQGKPLALPFLEIDEELWDREWKRLTLLFDPGRIKRGLIPHDEAGIERHARLGLRFCRDRFAHALPLDEQ